MNPKISVITISYNNREGLEKTLKSVTSQDYKDFEYIVIDGGSNDGSKELLESYSDKISHWVSEPDKGIYNAMNKGIKESNGEYLLFINSGDNLFENNTLEKVAPLLYNSEIISGNLKFVNKEKEWIGIAPETITFHLFFSNTLWHPSTFIKKNAFEKLGLYDERLKIVADWKWFMIAICKYKLSYKSISETISTFYLDGLSSDENSKKITENERKSTISQEFPFFLKDYEKLINLEKQIYNAQIIERQYNQLLKSKIIKLAKKMNFLITFKPLSLNDD